jgi:hypothetical protein
MARCGWGQRSLPVKVVAKPRHQPRRGSAMASKNHKKSVTGPVLGQIAHRSLQQTYRLVISWLQREYRGAEQCSMYPITAHLHRRNKKHAKCK